MIHDVSRTIETIRGLLPNTQRAWAHVTLEHHDDDTPLDPIIAAYLHDHHITEPLLPMLAAPDEPELDEHALMEAIAKVRLRPDAARALIWQHGRDLKNIHRAWLQSHDIDPGTFVVERYPFDPAPHRPRRRLPVASGYVHNGKRQGLWRWWTTQGTLWQACNMVDDQPHGVHKLWYTNDPRAHHSNHQRRPSWFHVEVEPLGNPPVVRMPTIPRAWDPLAMGHFEADALASVCVFWHGKLHGPYRSISVDGLPIDEGVFEAGAMSDLWRHHYPSGRLREEVQYLKGQRHGVSRLYHPSGIRAGECWWHHGKRHGAYISRRRQNGQIDEEGHFEHGEPNGQWRRYHPNGTPFEEWRPEGSLVIPNPMWTRWHDNGAAAITHRRRGDHIVRLVRHRSGRLKTKLTLPDSNAFNDGNQPKHRALIDQRLPTKAHLGPDATGLRRWERRLPFEAHQPG